MVPIFPLRLHISLWHFVVCPGGWGMVPGVPPLLQRAWDRSSEGAPSSVHGEHLHGFISEAHCCVSKNGACACSSQARKGHWWGGGIRQMAKLVFQKSWGPSGSQPHVPDPPPLLPQGCSARSLSEAHRWMFHKNTRGDVEKGRWTEDW